MVHAHEEQPERAGRAVRPRETGAVPSAPGHAEEILRLQRSAGNRAVARMLGEEPSTVRGVLNSPGRPLGRADRDDFEERFDTDFSDVRLHTGTAAQRSAAEIGARAYTSGNHIVIGEGGDDRHTMAHELTHVIQQRQGPVPGELMGDGLRVSRPDDESERVAEATATEVLRAPARDQWPALRRSAGLAGVTVQRAPKAKPDPVLTAEALGGSRELEGVCGYFQRVRRWKVQNAVTGVIIQRVNRTFNVQAHQGNGIWAPLAGAALDNYVTDPGSTVDATTTQYWELWWLSGPRGGFLEADGREDTFSLPSLIPNANTVADTTRGSFNVRGEARFYPTTLTPEDLGFARDAVSAAGSLYSRTTNPAGDLTAKGVQAVGSANIYTVDVTWDSATSTDLLDGHPRAAWSDVTAS